MFDFIAQVQKTVLAVFVSMSSVGIGAMPPEAIPSTQPSPTPSVEMISTSGEYTYYGQKLTYTLEFPKNGGPVVGKVEGLCKGQLSGNYEGPQSSKATASGEAVCLGFQRGTVNFEGNVNAENRKISGNATVKSEVYNGTYPVEFSF